jgi:hypothetical protein
VRPALSHCQKKNICDYMRKHLTEKHPDRAKEHDRKRRKKNREKRIAEMRRKTNPAKKPRHKCSNEWCAKSYKWKYHLTRHKSGCRDKRGDVECSNEWCGKLQRPGDLARHQKDCRDTRGKFTCKVCSRRFVRRECLTRHAGKCAKCQYCPEIFESTARFVRS